MKGGIRKTFMSYKLYQLRAAQRIEFSKDAVMIDDRMGYPVSLAIERFGSGIIDRVRNHNKPVKEIEYVDGSYYRSHAYTQPVNVFGLTTFIIKNKTKHREYDEYLTLYGYQLASDLSNLSCGKIFFLPSIGSMEDEISETKNALSKLKTRIRNLMIKSIDAELDHDENRLTNLQKKVRNQEEEYASLQERLRSLCQERDAKFHTCSTR